jgi:hypothetical protein
LPTCPTTMCWHSVFLVLLLSLPRVTIIENQV